MVSDSDEESLGDDDIEQLRNRQNDLRKDYLQKEHQIQRCKLDRKNCLIRAGLFTGWLKTAGEETVNDTVEADRAYMAAEMRAEYAAARRHGATADRLGEEFNDLVDQALFIDKEIVEQNEESGDRQAEGEPIASKADALAEAKANLSALNDQIKDLRAKIRRNTADNWVDQPSMRAADRREREDARERVGRRQIEIHVLRSQLLELFLERGRLRIEVKGLAWEVKRLREEPKAG
jgi:hypothetical protein